MNFLVAHLDPLGAIITNMAENSELPVFSRQAAVSINGQHTEVLVQRFTDRIFILITQMNKVGALFQASAPSNAPQVSQLSRRDLARELRELGLDFLPPPDPSIAVSSLLGRTPSEEQESLYLLYVSELASIVLHHIGTLPPGREEHQPFEGQTVVVALALKDVRRGADSEKQAFILERSTFANVLKMVLDCRVW